MNTNKHTARRPGSRTKGGHGSAAKFVLACLLSAVMGLQGVTAQAAVTIDQSPLIIQKPLPPNLVLMLDDSGSMAWDTMPDYGYLSSTDLIKGLRNSAVNGVYYNPAITYTPPPEVNGSLYPANPISNFPKAYSDPVAGDMSLVNLSTETSSYVGSGFKYYDSSNKKKAFAFTVQNGSTYTNYHVSTDCTGFTNCYPPTDTSGLLAPANVQAGVNILNWYSYYGIRIKMARSGLMTAFVSLDPGFRVGFGSIDGNNIGGLPSDTYSYWDGYNGQTNYIAKVKSFGNGTSGTQKSNFWNWISGENANGGTPLRQALNYTGKYYETAQPWETGGTGADASSKYACRPSFTILTTDGFWNDNSPGVGNVDNTIATKITTPSNYQYTPVAPFMDSYGDTLADVAMKYWVKDLRTDVPNEVPTTPNDPAFWQHMTTFTMGLGFTPIGITPSSITINEILSWATTGTPPAGVTSSSFSWPKPQANSINNIADLAHAAVNGHGNFFSAKNPADFVSGIKSALAAIADRQGAGSAITLSGTSTVTSTDPLYQFRATYYTGQWTGALTADIWNSALQTYVQDWSANNAFPTAANRNIWTVDKSSTGSGSQTSLEFKLDASNNLPAISTAEQAGLKYYLNGVLQTGSPETTILNYLRGDNTYAEGNSGGTLRARKAVLGDIISSTPVYVAAPDKNLFVNASFPGASTYGAFVAANKNRLPLVYAAANDGMLHAFRVKQGLTNNLPDPAKPAGQEVYAYLPGAVLSQPGSTPGGISNLANPQYGVVDGVTGNQAVPHQYYNDGRITTQNVYLDGQWRTILIGTTGRGPARAIYALDITDPSVLTDPTKSASALLWERSAGDIGVCTGTVGSGCSSYIGEMTGAPVIAQIQQNGATGPTNPPKWAVFIGNGYNSAQDKAALLQFDLKTGALDVHTTDGTTSNGLAEPGLRQPDRNNGESTHAYAGDLYGNLWAFDLKSATSAGNKIFIAKDANGTTQPITSLVALDYDTKTNSTWAYFGTGKYLSTADVTNSQIQTWYGLRVDVDVPLGGMIPSSTPIVSASTTRSNLTQRSIVNEQAGTGGTTLRATSQQTAGDMNNKAGWYLDLSTQSGERIVNRTQFIGSLVTVTTLIPKVDDPCNTVPSGAVMMVDPFTGANLAADFGLGAYSHTVNGNNVVTPFNGVIFQSGPAAGVTGSYNPDGSISMRFNTLSGGTANLGPIKVPGSSAGRLSWRELLN